MADITAGPDSGSNGAPLTPTYWFYLDAKNQHTGPYIASAFKGACHHLLKSISHCPDRHARLFTVPMALNIKR